MKEVTPTNLASQMKEDYMAYSMAVLLGRAIPDMYDGMKPAQRRVLQTMFEEGLVPDKRYVKCARVTGLTMGYYHPHGDCYGTLVNMATSWNNNVPWVDGHGNFGSTVDGPAAARYTECKLRPSSIDLLLQDKEIWETRDNYDGSRQEAVRFNTVVPSVLLNGDSGIAVGFATKLAPHSLRSVVEATRKACGASRGRDEAAARVALTPDFPTGCDVVEDDQLEAYRATGSGNIRCRARVESGVQKRSGKAKDRQTLTFTNLPPGANPEKLGEQIRDALEKGKIEGIAEVLDESDLSGDRFTIVAKPGVDVDLLSKQIFANTDLDSRYSAKTLVIDGTRPVELSPVEICQRWFSWRVDRLEVKFRHELGLKEGRLEIVSGLIKAIDKIDAIIKLIRGSASRKEALIKLVDRPYKFTYDQANAILEMRLRQLTGLDKTSLEEEAEELQARIKELEKLLGSAKERETYIFKEMELAAKRHGEARKSNLIPIPDSIVVTREKGMPRQNTVQKPRFLKVDMKKGVVEVAKGPRGALILERSDKLITLTADGTLKKLPATFKGTLGESYSEVLLARKETEVVTRKYLVVFELDGALKAMVLDGKSLAKTTSKGKALLSTGTRLIYFGEGSYNVIWKSHRKKPTVLDLAVKPGKPGGKGVKIANIADIAQ